MTLSVILVGVLAVLGLWSLVLTGHFLNTRQTQPTVVFLCRVLFILVVWMLIMVHLGLIPDTVRG